MLGARDKHGVFPALIKGYPYLVNRHLRHIEVVGRELTERNFPLLLAFLSYDSVRLVAGQQQRCVSLFSQTLDGRSAATYFPYEAHDGRLFLGEPEEPTFYPEAISHLLTQFFDGYLRSQADVGRYPA